MSNVKVYLRIKPHLGEREQTPLPMEVQSQGGRKRLYFQYRLQQNDTKIFNFDNIFQEDSSQDEVYNEFSADLMTSVRNGTSSGKSYTLLGGEVEGSEGILPRFVQDLFEFKQQGDYEHFEVKCSFFEIYNEQIYDLLQQSENPKKGVFVENLSHLEVDTLEEMLEYFAIGMSHRSTAETRLNERSSRSHGIFTIKVEHIFEDGALDNPDPKAGPKKSNQTVKIKRCSTIHFVDLAGSERQFESDADRLKETCQINKSLVVLSNVITSMTEKNKRYMHFRDSKLTFYLRDVFGGNSRTTVITNVLNESSYYFETWNTLRFAAKAKSIKVSPKANFDTEGSEEALKQEIDRLLRKIDQLEKNQHGPVQTSPVNNQQVIKLVDRLEHAWDNVINGIEERQLLFKEAISKADEYFINLIMEFRQCLIGRGSEILLKSKFLPILEEMEEFFGQNWNGLGPREVIGKLHCFHEIVKDEIKALKGVVQSKPQTARDKLKRIKKRWQNSLERIDEIMSDEEEEKEIINGLLSCMDEPTAAPETLQQIAENPDNLSQLEKRFTWGAPQGQSISKQSKPSSYGELDVNRNLMIDLTSMNKQQNNEQYFGKENFDVDQSVTNKTGRLSSSRAKDIKMAEVQELLSQFTPQRIRMVIKENDLLNKKIQKQRFLILEMKKKMDEVEEQRAIKTHRLNRSCDDIPTSLLGNLEKVVDESVAPWNENEIKQFDSIYDDRKSMHWRRSTNKSRHSNHVVPVRGQSIEVFVEDDIKINSPRNEMAESIREILSLEDLQQRHQNQILANGKSSLKIEESKKAELMSNLFDPAKRFQPTSHQQWRDTAFARDSVMPDAYDELQNPMIPHEKRGNYEERLSESVLVGSSHKDPFSHDVLLQYGTSPEKYKVVSESPGVFKKENHRLKSGLETLSKKFRNLEEQKAKLEKRLIVSDDPKDSRVNFSKNKTTVENEIVASERLNSQIVQDPSSHYRPKPISNPAKIPLFSTSQTLEVESRSNRKQIIQENVYYKYREENTYTPMSEAPSFGKQLGPSTIQVEAWPTSQVKIAMVSPSYKTGISSKFIEETPPRIVTDFVLEDSMRRSNNDEEVKVLEALLSEKNKETIGYLKLIEKLQKENDQLRETTDGGSSLSLYKLKLENKKLKEAIKKIAGKVKREIDSDNL